jgi:hypothetical protein
MHYLTFIFKDPDTHQIRCVGVKYKKTPFSELNLSLLIKNGTSNKEVKEWLSELRKLNKLPILEVLYRGQSSCDACYEKQKVFISTNKEGIELLGQKPLTKKYTKKIRNNSNTRQAISDQYGNSYSGVLEAAEELLLAPSNISKVLHGKLKHIGGYKFSFT